MPWATIQETASALKWALAGLFGAVTISRLHKDEFLLRRDFWLFVASGAFSAHYLTSLVAYYANVTDDHIGAVAFLVGAFGGSIFQALAKAVRAADLWSLIKHRLGSPK